VDDAALPVVIVGNGPVGQTTALLLAHWGVPSVLLDEREQRDAVGSKAICQQRDVLDVWDTIGAGRQIADEGVTWVRARTYYRGQELFTVEFAERGRPAFPPFVNISQCRTEEILDEQVGRQPLIEARWGTRVTGLAQDGDGVTLDAQGPGGPHRIHAPYAVLASGARSQPLRDQLGVGFPGRSFEDHFLICDIRCELPGWERERRFYFDPAWNPGRQVLIHPCPEATYRIDWQVPPDFDLEQAERTGELDRRIRAIIGERHYEIRWRSLYRFHARLAERMQVGRVLLAGDCAHLMAPFGARGLNSGVGDAENAAWKIAWAVRGWAGPGLLPSYHDERHAAARENLDVTAHTMDFLVPQTEEARRRRTEVLEAALTDPARRGEVDSGRLSEPFWYVHSPLTTPDPSRAPASRPPRGEVVPPGVGVLIPDAPVRDPDTGGTTRLRLLARTGVSVLVQDEAAAEAAAKAVASLSCPSRVLRLQRLSHDVGLAADLGMWPGESWVLRPDAHVAAVLTAANPVLLRASIDRMLGFGPG
jgi:pentachlorophenol monooxygenase/3-(3-hydroxy-phenyl)propionate hydroxylase